jgi:hypothetical protein
MLLLSAAILVSFTACEEKKGLVISRSFVNDTTYEVVVRGYPKKGTTGVARMESAKRAALLNAYYIIRQNFSRDVAPDRNGRVMEYVVQGDSAVVRYRLKHPGLRQYYKQK